MRLLLPVGLVLPLAVLAQEIDFDDLFDDMPSQRFNPWQLLSAATKTQASTVTYSEDTWNVLGSADIEESSFDELTGEQQAAVLAIGINEDQWDCYMNHYDGYSWQDLIDEDDDLDSYMTTLGWTQATWDDDYAENPPTLDKDWDDLTADEQEAASQICWFPEAWEEVPLQNMENIPVVFPEFRFKPWTKLSTTHQAHATNAGWTEETWDRPGTAAVANSKFSQVNPTIRDALTQLGFYEEQFDCYINHYQAYTWTELADLGIQRSAETAGWTETTWSQGAVSSLDDLDWKDMSDAQADALDELCWFQLVWDEDVLGGGGEVPPPPTPPPQPAPTNPPQPAPTVPPQPAPTFPTETEEDDGEEFPQVRFTPWSHMTHKGQATNMGYTKEAWNVPGESDLEQMRFDDLSDDQQRIYTSITGTGRESWDCWVNHYSGYDWDDLEYEEVTQHAITLGYTRQMWDNDEPLDTDDKYWDDLTEEEKEAATELCYFEELWDETDLEIWRGIAFPTSRYSYEWAAMNDEDRDMAVVLGYRSDTWDNPGTNEDLEELNFDELTQEQQAAVEYFGMYRANYDCYINHYDGFTWEELQAMDMIGDVKRLGFNEQIWSSDFDPPSFDKDWDDLTDAEQEGAKRICYFKELWDEIPMTEWANDAGDPVDEIGSTKSEGKAIMSSSSSGSNAGKSVGITIAVLAGLAIVAVGVLFVIKRRRSSIEMASFTEDDGNNADPVEKVETGVYS